MGNLVCDCYPEGGYRPGDSRDADDAKAIASVALENMEADLSELDVELETLGLALAKSGVSISSRKWSISHNRRRLEADCVKPEPRRASVSARNVLRAQLCSDNNDAAKLAAMHAEIVPLGKQAFAIMDIQIRGYVTAIDAITLYARLGVRDRRHQDAAFGEILKETDTTGDGRITKEEWSAWVTRLADHSCAPYGTFV